MLQEIEGHIIKDKQAMLSTIDAFLSMNSESQLLYRVGRQTGVYSKLSDLHDDQLKPHAQYHMNSNNITADNIDEVTSQLMERFI